MSELDQRRSPQGRVPRSSSMNDLSAGNYMCLIFLTVCVRSIGSLLRLFILEIKKMKQISRAKTVLSVRAGGGGVAPVVGV